MDLKFGFKDAENYIRKSQKELFNKLFIITDDLKELCDDSTFFLIGEKGTGKTAYAIYISNNSYLGNTGTHKNIVNTDYHKFIKLKMDKQLQLPMK